MANGEGRSCERTASVNRVPNNTVIDWFPNNPWLVAFAEVWARAGGRTVRIWQTMFCWSTGSIGSVGRLTSSTDRQILVIEANLTDLIVLCTLFCVDVGKFQLALLLVVEIYGFC